MAGRGSGLSGRMSNSNLMCGEMYFCWAVCECVLLTVTVQCSSLKHVLGGDSPPASNPPHIPSLNSTAVPPSPPTGGVAAAVSQSTTDRRTNSSLEIKHHAGKSFTDVRLL